MHVEWKIVTDNPQVTRKSKEVAKNVMCMQYQRKACASDLCDGSHVTLILFEYNTYVVIMQSLLISE